jgi:hypothetical protein
LSVRLFEMVSRAYPRVSRAPLAEVPSEARVDVAQIEACGALGDAASRVDHALCGTRPERPERGLLRIEGRSRIQPGSASWRCP